MGCEITTVLAEACASGIGKLQSRIELLQTWGQLLCSGASPCEAPAAPELSATIVYESDGNYTLNWTAPAGAVGYLLDLAEDADFTIQIFINQPYATNTSGVINDVADATRYARVRAVSDCGAISDYSNVITFNTSIPAIGFSSLTSFVSANIALADFTTSAYQPESNALLLAFIFCTVNPPATVTGNGLTWVLVGQCATTVGNIQRCSVWRAMGAAPTNTGLSVTGSGGQGGIIIQVQQYTNVATGGTNGSAALWQQLGILSNTVQIAPLNTNSRNAIVGASVIQSNPTGASLEAGWTQDLNTAQTPSFSLGVFIAHRLATTDASFNSSMAGDVASIAMEIVSAYSTQTVALPSSIANLEIWSSTSGGVYQDAAKAVPCTNGTTAYTWDNQGNTAVVSDWIQATGALRPTYSTGGQNGKPKLTFNNSKMSNTCGNFAQPFTSIFVATYSGNVGGAGVLLGDTIGLAAPSVIDPSAFGYIYMGSAVISGTIAVGATPFLIIGIPNGASSQMYTNTLPNLSGNPGALGFTSPFYIGKHVADAFYIIGDFYEQMFFSRVLTTAEICTIQIYVRQTYALGFD